VTAKRLSRTAKPTLASVSDLTAAIDAWAREQRVPERARRALLLVHDELASNVARHASGARRMSIGCRLDGRRGRLHYRLEDDGAPFDLGALRAPDTSAPLAERTPGGLGIHLVRTLARSFRWRRIEDRNRTEVELALEEES
jgi:anti-sigma regulatory factor (Ser/Thr protein kinase)